MKQNKNSKYKVIALVGKSGAGKDTIARILTTKYPEAFHSIISATTRPRRDYEKDGVDYYFMSESNFKKSKMLETTKFNNWYYGTPIKGLKKDKINVGVFNPQGVKSLMGRKDIDLTVYYVQAADRTRLERQLRRENNPNCAEICRRFFTDEKDFDCMKKIPHIVFQNEDTDNVQIKVTVAFWSMRVNFIKEKSNIKNRDKS